MKLKLLFVSVAITLAQITPSDAQSISPAGHYTKKRGGAGEMWVQKAGAEWRIFVNAGGIPRPRGLFIWLYRRYPRILDAMSIVRPETVVRWHRKGFYPATGDGNLFARGPAANRPRGA
jgi:hypothetical protein